RCAILLTRLLDAGVIDLVCDPLEVIDEVGLFSVPKKSGGQCLVVDASSPAVLWAAPADVAGAFYRVGLPLAWWPYFALLSTDEWRLGRSAGAASAGSRKFLPRLALMPAGWARALALRQRVAESAADWAGLARAARIVDRPMICPDMGGRSHLEYVESFAALTLGAAAAQRFKDDVVRQLR
ncbi:unnamed protein product, partial [Prorocentrum cordatum]